MLTRLLSFVLWVPPTGDPEQEQRARFLAALILTFVPPATLFGLVLVPLWIDPNSPTSTHTFASTLALLSALVGSFVLNRGGRRSSGAMVLMTTLLGAIVWSSLERPQLMVFLSLLVMLAMALCAARVAVAFGLVGLLFYPLLILLSPNSLTHLVVPLGLNIVCLAVSIVTKLHQNNLERKRLEELQRRERWFSTTLSSIGDAVMTVDTAKLITFMNPVAEALTGWNAAEAVGSPADAVFDIFDEQTGESAENPIEKVLELGTVVGLANHTVLVARDGVRRPIADSGAPIVDAAGETYGVVLVFRDMTEEHALQARVQHSQRLDSLGQLAGGVAHDFNNLLTAIGGCTELVMAQLPPEHEHRVELQDVLDATDRAVELTRQLLAFSRRQVMQVQAVELSAALASAERLLRRLLRESTTLKLDADPDAGWVAVDPVQLEQVLINLAINASDAMLTGGTLTLSVAGATVTTESPVPLLAPGRYGRLRVQDTGGGIEEGNLKHIFEPFFTTKEKGRGTGLGLATVYGIVTQSGGTVRVQSELGNGTTFEVFLPTINAPQATRESRSPPPIASPSGEVATILIVEDDPMVRRLAVRALSRSGHRMLEAESGSLAVERLKSGLEEIDLLVTDIVMPGLNGTEVARAFRSRFPSLPVVYMSGYADEVVAREGVDSAGGTFLPKPFTPAGLLKVVQLALRERAHAGTRTK